MASQASHGRAPLRGPRALVHPRRRAADRPEHPVFSLDPLAVPLGPPPSSPSTPTNHAKGDLLWLGHSWAPGGVAPFGRRLQDSRYEPFGAPPAAPPSPSPAPPSPSPQPVAMPDAARLDRERDWERRGRPQHHHLPLVHQRSLDGHLSAARGARTPHHLHHHYHRDGTQTVTLTAELGPPQLPPQHQLSDKEACPAARSAGPHAPHAGPAVIGDTAPEPAARARTPPVPPVKFCASSVKARLESSPSSRPSRPCSGPSPTPAPAATPTPRPGSDQPERAELRYEPPAVVCSLELLEPVLEPLRSEIVFHTSPLADSPPAPPPAPALDADTSKALEALDEATQNLLQESQPGDMLEPVRVSMQFWPVAGPGASTNGSAGGPQRAAHHLPEPMQAPQKASPTFQQRPQQAQQARQTSPHSGAPRPPSVPPPPPPAPARGDSPVYQEPFQGPAREDSPVYAQPYQPSPTPVSEHFEKTCVEGESKGGGTLRPASRKEDVVSLTRRLALPAFTSSEDEGSQGSPTLKPRLAHAGPHRAVVSAAAVDVRSCLNLMACRLPQNQQSLEEDAEAEAAGEVAEQAEGAAGDEVVPKEAELVVAVSAPSPTPSAASSAPLPLFQHRRLSAPAPLSSSSSLSDGRTAVPQMAVVQSSWWPVVQPPSPSPAWNWAVSLPVPPPPPPAAPLALPAPQVAVLTSTQAAAGAPPPAQAVPAVGVDLKQIVEVPSTVPELRRGACMPAARGRGSA